MANINTRIVLRNDDITKWESSTLSLLQGEIALAKRADGSYDIRVGDGSSTWKDLSSSFAISSDQVIGLDAELEKIHVPQVYTEENVDTTKALDTIISESSELSAKEFGAGDVLILKNASGVASAYHFDKEDGWVACDGNVDASKVILANSIDLAGEWTAIGNVKKASNSTITTGYFEAGSSVQDLLVKTFDKVTNPTATKPTCSVSLTGAGEKEIGTTFTPAFTTGYTDGKFVASPVTVNAGCAKDDTTWSVTDGTNTVTGKTSGNIGSAFTVGNNTNYSLTANVGYAASTNVAQTNKGTAYPSLTISAGTTSNATSSAVKGYRKMFWYTGDVFELTGANIREKCGTSTAKTASGSAKAAKGNHAFSVAQDSKMFLIAVPKDACGLANDKTAGNYSVTVVADKNAFGTDIIGSFETKEITIPGAGSDTGIAYNVYVKYAALDANTYTITVA